MRTLRAICALAVVVVAACSSQTTTVSEVVAKYRDALAKKREQFGVLAGVLPPSAYAEQCPRLDPRLTFNKKSRAFNTEFVMIGQLRDPDADQPVDLYLHADLLNAILWTGPKNPLVSAALEQNGEDMERQLKAALNTRYLVVSRIDDIVKPLGVDEKTYSPGRYTMTSFVVDLMGNKVLCGFPVSGQSPAYLGWKGDALRERAWSFMWSDLRNNLAKKLDQNAKAEIVLD